MTYVNHLVYYWHRAKAQKTLVSFSGNLITPQGPYLVFLSHSISIATSLAFRYADLQTRGVSRLSDASKPKLVTYTGRVALSVMPSASKTLTRQVRAELS